jgi:hypothetical protein
VGSKSTNMCSYVWRLWWGRTSFYLRTRDNSVFPDLKVSLHGPDPRHPTSGYKIGRDGSAVSESMATREGLVVAPPDWLPCWFNGRAVSDTVTHVLRFRFPPNLFDRRYPSAPIPAEVKERDFAGVFLPPNKALYAVDVDVYLSNRAPFWPNERRARRDDACLGPLQNEAGQHLTAVAVHRSTITAPTPRRAQAPRPTGAQDRVRGVGATVDDTGVLWICEQWMSRSALLAGGGELAPV